MFLRNSWKKLHSYNVHRKLQISAVLVSLNIIKSTKIKLIEKSNLNIFLVFRFKVFFTFCSCQKKRKKTFCFSSFQNKNLAVPKRYWKFNISSALSLSSFKSDVFELYGKILLTKQGGHTLLFERFCQ